MSQPRIASLVPSATEIVAALGLAGSIVARSHECDWPRAVTRAPACTRARIDATLPSGAIHAEVGALLSAALSLYDLDTDILREARPSHIVTQDQCDVCAVGLGEVEAAAAQFLDGPVQIVSLAPMRLGDVWADIARVGTALGVDARPVCEGLQARVAAIAERAGALPPRRVLTVEWSDPPMTAGNWVPELVALAGGIDTLGADGGHSPRITVEAVAAADADAIVLMPCGYDLPRTAADGRALHGRCGLGRTCARSAPARSTPPTAMPSSTGRDRGSSSPSKSWPKSSIRRTSTSATKAPGGTA